MGVVSQLQHDESKNIAYQSQQSQLDCHMEELNHSFEQLEMVIESEWQRNQHKIKKDLLLLTKQKCGKV